MKQGAAPNTRPLAGARTRPPAYAFAIGTLAAIVVTANLLGAGPMRASLWGTHAYGFLPRYAHAAGLALLALVGIVIALQKPGKPGTPASSRVPAAVIAAALASPLGFWRFREGHTFLGDGNPLIADLPRGLSFHAHEPLTVMLQQALYRWTGPWFAAPGKTPDLVARDAVALGSCVAGGVFVWLAWELAAELAGSVPKSVGGVAGARRDSPLVLWLLLLLQGYVQLFFGYVENYAYVSCAITAYLWLALRALRGRTPLAAPALLLALAIGLDLSAGLLVPSFLLLAAFELANPARRRSAALGLAAAVGALALLQAGLARLGGGFALADAVSQIVIIALNGHGEPGRFAALFTVAHLRDVLSEQMLIGPLAGVGLLVVLPLLARGGRAPDRGLTVLGVAALAALAAGAATGDLNLGYARDWDLFAPFGIPIATTTLAILLKSGATRRAFAFLLALSAFHTLPWIAVNASFDRSFERLKTLPLGYGRAESDVAHYYFAHGDMAAAKRWYQLSVQAYSQNGPSHFYLGVFALDDGALPAAIAHLRLAVRVRPDKDDYRLRLADAYVLAGVPDSAAVELGELVRHAPARPEYWAAYAVALRGSARIGESRAACARTLALAPADTLFHRVCTTLEGPGGYAEAVANDWTPLVLR